MKTLRQNHQQRSDQEHHHFLQILIKRIFTSILILIAIAFLTQIGLNLASLGKSGIATSPLNIFIGALFDTFKYIANHPKEYYWNQETLLSIKLIIKLFITSFGLIIFSLTIASFLGITIGIIAAQIKKRILKPIMLIISILGISTPSFLLAMLFWVFNINLYKWLGLKHAILPLTGFGWDAHILMPALVLAMRPFSQIMQVTYINLLDIFNQDYINAAKARGLSNRLRVFRHALPNIYVPILTTLGVSLRFSLASLPVVESFFYWPGIGRSILQAISLNMTTLVTDLTVSLGLMFLAINFGLEIIFPILDPRLKNNFRYNEQVAQLSKFELNESIFEVIRNWITRNKFSLTKDIKRRFYSDRVLEKHGWPPKAYQSFDIPHSNSSNFPTGNKFDKFFDRFKNINTNYSIKYKDLLKNYFSNLPLIVGSILVVCLLIITFFGEWFTTANPYETHGIMMINGVINAPPFDPSDTFPWGSDIIGRDMKSLVLNGAKQTLSLALLAMLARIFVGTVIGTISGWWENSWFDRTTKALISIWSAFPLTIFAMVIILAIGIEKGMPVFVIALCIVGWGEIAQYIHNQVVGQKPELYIEASRSIGARPHQILIRNILPHLIPQIFILSALEMGSILMLLAELGYLNIFLGGGFKLEIAELARVPTVYFYSDVPEWGAMLANIREWWRSYPWLAWYPGLFFFISILAFNLFGEGFRRFIHDSRINLSRIFNRYTFALTIFLGAMITFLIQSTAPIEIYKTQSQQFNAQQAFLFAEELSSNSYYGRESGTQNAANAANYIADQMEKIGLFPAGENDTYIQTIVKNYFHLSGTPEMILYEDEKTTIHKLDYRVDFVEYIGNKTMVGEAQGQVIGVIPGKNSDSQMILNDPFLEDKILIIEEDDLGLFDIRKCKGILIIDHDPDLMEKKYLYPYQDLGYRSIVYPIMAIPPSIANNILGSCNSSLESIDQKHKDIHPNSYELTDAGIEIYINIPGNDNNIDETYNNVIGFIPGIGAKMGDRNGAGLDNQVIIVSAYYDGLGLDTNGIQYPGANDNASGVATMLEVARVLKQAPYQPKKTVVFVAWSGGERNESLSTENIMNAKTGFGLLNVEAVIELSGVGAGSGNAIAIEKGTSFRLTNLIEDAASRLGIKTTTRGSGPHFGYEARPSFGGRTALSAYLAWDGSNITAHTTNDSIDDIDPEKMQKVGQTTLLTLSVIGRETEY